jgi:hypothetical protein
MPKEISFIEHYARLLLHDIGVNDTTIAKIRKVTNQCIFQWRIKYIMSRLKGGSLHDKYSLPIQNHGKESN